jgi:hypothetical protein
MSPLGRLSWTGRKTESQPASGIVNGNGQSLITFHCSATAICAAARLIRDCSGIICAMRSTSADCPRRASTTFLHAVVTDAPNKPQPKQPRDYELALQDYDHEKLNRGMILAVKILKEVSNG